MSSLKIVLIFFFNHTKNSKTKLQPWITWIQIPLDSPCNSCLPSSLCFVSAVTLFTAFRLCQMMSRPTSNSTFHMVSCRTFRLGILHICDPFSGHNTYVMVPAVMQKKKEWNSLASQRLWAFYQYHLNQPFSDLSHLVTPNSLESCVIPHIQDLSLHLQLLSACYFNQLIGPSICWAGTGMLTCHAEVPPREVMSTPISHHLGGTEHLNRGLLKSAAL